MISAVALSAAPAGHLEGWGFPRLGGVSISLAESDLIGVAAGHGHGLALRANGTVTAWGRNDTGQTTIPAGLTGVTQIAAAAHSVALKQDGTVVVWGHPSAVVRTVPSAATNIVAISAGASSGGSVFTLALRRDGRVFAWGNPCCGETDVPASLSNVQQISAGMSYALALRTDGSVVGWGLSEFGKTILPPNAGPVVAVRAGQSTSLALRSDGTVIHWGGPFDSNAPPAGISGLIDISVGFQHVLGLRNDGTIIGWGAAFDSSSVPTDLSGVFAISAGGNDNAVLSRRPLVTGISPPQRILPGATVAFSVQAIGEQLSFGWRRGGINIGGRAGATLTINDAQAEDVGVYDVYVTNPFGRMLSPATSLRFQAPRITLQPQGASLFRGESHRMFIEANGTVPPLSFQWLKDGETLSRETGSALDLNLATRESAGEYLVRVTDALGESTTSIPVLVDVEDPFVVSARFHPFSDTSLYSSGSKPGGLDTILVGTRKNGVRDRGLIRFDLSSLPKKTVVKTVRLKLRTVREPSIPFDSLFSIYRVFRHWNDSATWLNRVEAIPWSMPGGAVGTDYDAKPSAAVPVERLGWYEFGPTAELNADVQLWIDSPESNHGWMIISDAESTGRSARHFGSSESSTPPELIIDGMRLPRAPALKVVAHDSEQLRLKFSAEPGGIYDLEERSQLSNAAWELRSSIAAPRTATELEINVPTTANQSFFRIGAR